MRDGVVLNSKLSKRPGHLHDTIMYNDVMKFAREWIDAHPDTMMLSAADHECGGLTLNGFDPVPLKDVSMSIERVGQLWDAYNGTDRRAYLADTILPGYGLSGLSDAEIDQILANDDLGGDLTKRLSDKAGVHWSTGGHTATDITLFGYGSGWRGGNLKADMAGNWDNTQVCLNHIFPLRSFKPVKSNTFHYLLATGVYRGCT